MSGVALWPIETCGLAPIMELMENGFVPDFGERWNASQLSDLLTSNSSSWLMVDDPDLPRGFALTRVSVDEAELMLLTVRSQARLQGVARRLVKGVAGEARRRGADRLFAEVRVSNEAARFYDAIGFQAVGRRPRYYRGTDGTAHDAITVQLSLDELMMDD